MRFLSVDLSSKTGWAVFDDDKLLEYGLIKHAIQDYKASVFDFRCLPETYPYNLIDVSKAIAKDCHKVFRDYKCQAVVIEHTEKARQRISQKFLEFAHYAFFDKFRKEDVVQYLFCTDWRKQTKCRLSAWPEFQKWNKEVAAIKKRTKARLAKKDGKVVSKVDLKKLSIHIANEYYDIEIKDDNIADAINLGRAAYELGAFRNQPRRKGVK